jgi:hypothetical protein
MVSEFSIFGLVEWLGLVGGVTVLDSTVLGRRVSSFIVVVVAGVIVVATLIVVVYNLDLVSSYGHADSLPPSFQSRQIRYHLSPVERCIFLSRNPRPKILDIHSDFRKYIAEWLPVVR